MASIAELLLAELDRAFDEAVAAARSALAGTSDERLLGTRWQLRMQGNVLADETPSADERLPIPPNPR